MGTKLARAWANYRSAPKLIQILTPIVTIFLTAALLSGSTEPQSQTGNASAKTQSLGASDVSDSTAEKAAAAADQRAAAKKRALARKRAAKKAQVRRERRAREKRARARARARHARVVAKARERKKAAALAEKEAQNCDPNYEGACLDPNASDYDCEGGSGDGPKYTGPVQRVGSDPFDLDADGDGYACE